MTRPPAFTLARDILEQMTEEAKNLRDTAEIAELEAEVQYAGARGRRDVELAEQKTPRDLRESIMDAEEDRVGTELYTARRRLNRSKALAKRTKSAYEPLGRESYKRGNQYT